MLGTRKSVQNSFNRDMNNQRKNQKEIVNNYDQGEFFIQFFPLHAEECRKKDCIINAKSLTFVHDMIKPIQVKSKEERK